MPAVGGTITSYRHAERNSSSTSSALIPTGSVVLFFRPGGGLATQLWNWTNLSQLTGCAPLVGNITAKETSGRIVNISGVDASGNLWMITWRSGDGWRSTNATAAAAGAETLVPGSSTSWINSTAAPASSPGWISSGQIVLYRYTYTGGHNTWTFASISAAVSDAPALTGALRSTFTSAGAILITGSDENGEVVRFTFTPGQTWTAESVSEMLM